MKIFLFTQLIDLKKVINRVYPPLGLSIKNFTHWDIILTKIELHTFIGVGKCFTHSGVSYIISLFVQTLFIKQLRHVNFKRNVIFKTHEFLPRHITSLGFHLDSWLTTRAAARLFRRKYP